jgi:hypothetical protein
VRLPSVTTALLTTVPEAPAVAMTGMLISAVSPLFQAGPRLQLKVLPVVVHSASVRHSQQQQHG